MEVKQFERMRVGKREREEGHEVGVMLGLKSGFDELDELDPEWMPSTLSTTTTSISHAFTSNHTSAGTAANDPTAGSSTAASQKEQISDLEREVALLRGQLKKAKEINDQMWKGAVKRAFERELPNGNGSGKGDGEGDVDME